METLFDLTLRGVFLGVAIGVIALPISLLYLSTDVLDLAVGPYAVLSGAIASVVGGTVGSLFGVIGAITASAIVGGMSVLLGRDSRVDPMIVVLSTFGAALFLQSLALVLTGSSPIVDHPFHATWSVWGEHFSPEEVINIVVAVGVLLALSVVLQRTALGRVMRACAANSNGAALVGVPVKLVTLAVYVSGGILAGLAGILIMNTTGMEYYSGLNFTLTAFGSSLLFGLRSPGRAFAGGICMGLVEAWSSGYLPGGWISLPPLLVIFVLLTSGRMTVLAARGRA